MRTEEGQQQAAGNLQKTWNRRPLLLSVETVPSQVLKKLANPFGNQYHWTAGTIDLDIAI